MDPVRDVVSKAGALRATGRTGAGVPGVRGEQLITAGTQPDRTEARIRDSAREFESVFLSFLLKTMRRTVPQGGTPALGGGNRVYQEMMDDELARAMAKGRGVGLADILVRDLTRKNASSLPPERPMTNRHQLKNPSRSTQQ